jgi:hypothetical protein
MSNTKQTAVDFLIEYFDAILGVYIPNEKIPQNIIQQAKEIEEQQHKETFKQSRQAKIFEKDMPPVWESFEQYYKKTYKLGGNK